MLPWKDECQTLNFNLKKELDQRITCKSISEENHFENRKTDSFNSNNENEEKTEHISGITLLYKLSVFITHNFSLKMLCRPT